MKLSVGDKVEEEVTRKPYDRSIHSHDEQKRQIEQRVDAGGLGRHRYIALCIGRVVRESFRERVQLRADILGHLHHEEERQQRDEQSIGNYDARLR